MSSPSTLNVKSLYDIVNASDVPARILDNAAVDAGICRTHLLRKAFLGGALSDILKEIEKLAAEMSLWDIWRGRKKSFETLKAELYQLQAKAKEAGLEKQELPVLQQITRKWKSKVETESSKKIGVDASATITTGGPRIAANASVADFDRSLNDNELYNEYSDVVLRSFPFDEIISRVQELLEESGLKKVVIFFDDFSELSLLDQRLFVDVILAPLNNSSNEAIKLKIAGYPGRVYYGRIDATKVDTIGIDFATLYESIEVQAMEVAAIDYAHRLMLTRFRLFGEKIEDYFDPSIPIRKRMAMAHCVDGSSSIRVNLREP